MDSSKRGCSPGSFDNNGGGNIVLIKEAGTHNYSIVFSGCNRNILYFSECGN